MKEVIMMNRGGYRIPNIGALKGKGGRRILEIIKSTTPPDRTKLRQEARQCEEEIMALRKNGK